MVYIKIIFIELRSISFDVGQNHYYINHPDFYP